MATYLDAAEIEAVYARHCRQLRRIAYAIVKDHDGAEDCVHEVLVRVLSRPACFRPERGQLYAFLAACVRNEAIGRVRRAGRRAQIETRLEAQPESHTFEIDDFVELKRLARALSTLPGEQYAALELFYFGSLSHPEISKKLGVPLGTVKTRIRLAIKRLSMSLRPAAA